MPHSRSRFTWLAELPGILALSILGLIGMAFAVTAVHGILAIRQGAKLEPLLWWIIALLGEAAAAALVLLLYGLVKTVQANQSAVEAGVDRLNRLESATEAVLESSRRLVDLEQMSDAAKGLLFRDREYEAMNERLHEYLIRQDEGKAKAFVAEVEERLGYAEQVDRMRKELAAARETTMDQKVEAAVERVNKLIEAKDWARAGRQTRRLLELLPDNPKIAALPRIIREAQINHKRALLQKYGEAVKTSDVERGIELIQELDRYLTPQEGAALEESARSVFRAKLKNLGVTFAMHVSEENWVEALDIGQQIIREFPNSRMAEEVRQKLPRLTTLAAAQDQK
ncbi:MAG: hypothetical protein AMJ81_06710 [Phycisphaerae bacterium SM23_33]|nr:MAG: hypothetical protein AMJ81_06710 [Phycisphaerae bacterium SM23_33]